MTRQATQEVESTSFNQLRAELQKGFDEVM